MNYFFQTFLFFSWWVIYLFPAIFTYKSLTFWYFLLSPINYVSHVLLCSRALRALVPHVSRALCALVSHMPCAIRVFVLDVPRASCFTCSCALRALVLYMPRTLRSLVPHILCTLRALVIYVSYVLSYLTCLVLSSAACALCHTLSFAPHPLLDSGVSSLT